MSSPLRIGLIGLDTSHVSAFTQVLNDPAYPNHVPGGKVVAAYPGGSRDLELSVSRVAGFTQELKDKYAVSILDSPEAVAEACDLVFLESLDGRVHLSQLRRVLPFHRPVFVDKPLTTSSGDATEMFRLAREAGVPLMSCSALRYADNLVALLNDQALGDIVGCDAFGPMTEVPEPPGLFWYGIHTAEVLYSVMGAGCASVRAVRNDDGDLVTATWSDGRMACLRGLRRAHSQFGVTIHRQRGFQHANLSRNARPFYDGLVAAIMRSLPQGRSDVPQAQTLEIIGFLEAANQSRRNGRPVSIAATPGRKTSADSLMQT